MREMKDSGIEWIGEIPSTWNLTQTRRLFRNEKKVVGSAVDEYERLALTLNGVIKRSKEDSEGLQPEKFEGYQILQKNELVFKMIDLENVNTSRVGLSPYTGLVSPAYIVLKNDRNDNRFAYYWFMFMYYQEIFNHLGGDGVRSALNAKDMLSMPIPNISNEEQKKISDYLDAKCSRIDAIIARQEEIIEKLKEYKLSVITEAVTKGLDPDVEMKDSGVEWIGEIPTTWQTSKIKHHFKIGSGTTPKSDDPTLWDGEIIWITPADFKTDDVYVDHGHRNLSDTGFSGSSLEMIPAGNIIFSKRAPIGQVVINSVDLCTNQGCLTAIPRDTSEVRFYRYLMSIATEEFKLAGSGTTFKEISASSFGNIIFPLTDVAEQKRIADYLDSKCSKIDDIIARRREIVEKIKEYKKSLIYEVVTGKKEV